MRSMLRLCRVLLIMMLASCSTNPWDNMLRELSENNEVTVTILTQEFTNQQRFDADQEKLTNLLKEFKKEEAERATSEEDFTIVISGKKEYQLKVYKDAIIVNKHAIKLTATTRAKLQNYYRTVIYGENPSLLQQVKTDLRLGKYQDIEYFFPYESERFNFDTILVQEAIDGITEKMTSKQEFTSFTIDLNDASETFSISVNKNSIELGKNQQRETYSINGNQFDSIFSIVINNYLIHHSNDEDFYNSDIMAPAFLELKLQDLYKKAQRMYNYLAVGTLHEETVYGLLPCKSDSSNESECFYYPTNYKKFPTYQAFYDYLSSLYADSLRDELLANGFYRNIDGFLYVSPSGRGGHEYFMKETFEPIKQTDDEIQFYLVGHYSDDRDMSIVSETKKFLIELRKFDGDWKFTKFAVPY